LQTLQPPKPGGIFAQCVSWKTLTDTHVRGIVAEDVTAFGQRMQLLLDSQPVGPTDVFVDFQTDLLHWYTETRVSGLFGEAGPFHWLWQDVQRYWRSIRSRANWLHHNDPQKSLEVNLKLRSSRLILVAAFLQAIAETHRTTDSPSEAVDYLRQQLTFTPMERLVAAMPTSTEASLLLRAYQTIWMEICERPTDGNQLSPGIPAAIQQMTRCLTRLPGPQEMDWLF